MKLKQSSVPSAAPGGAAIAERFRLDADPRANRGAAVPSKAATTTAFTFALIALVIIGAIVGMMYVNWALVSSI